MSNQTYDPAYNVWKKMRRRCGNPKDDHYHWYGAKGVSVCNRWHDFRTFKADMGERPSAKHSIDRIDNSKGYEPGNCRWATQQEQNRNRAANTYITHNGKTQCLAAWSEELGGSRMLVSGRLRDGWSEIEAVTTPVLKGTNRSQYFTKTALEITNDGLNYCDSIGNASPSQNSSPGHQETP